MEEVKIKEFLDLSSGSGYGTGSGYGYGDGTGSGSGYGYGYGIEEINGQKVYYIDNVPTLLHSIHDNVAKGAILRSDMTLQPCYIVKGSGYFAHGETLRQAMDALADKILGGAPEEERIAAFVKAHPEYRKPYPNEDLFRWHHNLTGSCEMGRKTFIEERGLNLDGETTVEEFVKLTQNAYNGSVIRKLPAEYGEDTVT